MNMQGVRCVMVLLIVAGMFCSAVSADVTFVVATNGNDTTGNGSLQAPFRTLGRARQAVRSYVPPNDIPYTVRVQIRHGTYLLADDPYLNDPDYPGSLVLDASLGDAGSSHVTVVWESYPEESVLISGGRAFATWDKGPVIPGSNPERRWWGLYPSQGQLLPTEVRDLYLNNQRMIRARFPNAGYLLLTGTFDENNNTVLRGPRKLQVAQSIPIGGFADATQMEVVARREHNAPRQLILPNGLTTNTASLVHNLGNIIPGNDHLSIRTCDSSGQYGCSYVYLENAHGFMDVHSEWFYNKQHNKVNLILNDSYTQNPELGGIAIYPVVQRLVVCRRGSANLPFSNVHFKRLNFAHSAQPFPKHTGETADPGYNTVGAGNYWSNHNLGANALSGAIEFQNASDCSVSHCRIGHTGGHGIMMYGEDNVVEGTEVFDVGGTGIHLGFASPGLPQSSEITRRALVDNCYVHDYGQVYQDCVGIYGCFVEDTVIVNCEIANGGHNGIFIGRTGSCSNAPNALRSTISMNHVHHSQRVLKDSGAISVIHLQDVPANSGTACTNRPLIIEGNLVENVALDPTFVGSGGGSCVGINLDNKAVYWRISDNVIRDTEIFVSYNSYVQMCDPPGHSYLNNCWARNYTDVQWVFGGSNPHYPINFDPVGPPTGDYYRDLGQTGSPPGVYMQTSGSAVQAIVDNAGPQPPYSTFLETIDCIIHQCYP